MTQGYFIEHNGECWQSVFPEDQQDRSQLHGTVADAFDYMHLECNVPMGAITILPTTVARQ